MPRNASPRPAIVPCVQIIRNSHTARDDGVVDSSPMKSDLHTAHVKNSIAPRNLRDPMLGLNRI